MRDILRNVILDHNKNDYQLWVLDSTKLFSVNSCYKHLVCCCGSKSGDGSILLSAYTGLWTTSALSKILIFGWQFFTNSLPLHEVLFRHHVILTEEGTLCLFCRKEREDIVHLFFNCCFASGVWAKVGDSLGILFPVCDNMLDHFYSIGDECYGKKSKNVKYIIWLATCWCIWLVRNMILFKGDEANIESTVANIKCLY